MPNNCGVVSGRAFSWPDDTPVVVISHDEQFLGEPGSAWSSGVEHG
jgi:hypothetical protein